LYAAILPFHQSPVLAPHPILQDDAENVADSVPESDVNADPAGAW